MIQRLITRWRIPPPAPPVSTRLSRIDEHDDDDDGSKPYAESYLLTGHCDSCNVPVYGDVCSRCGRLMPL